ncbi:MAG: TetR/AcrR family transcriptional regulator [Mycobacteriaceae bacterium]|nr:TetR/AcrR family transcriptional regulator [Mycobacteriaceae bacterium]
MTQQTRQRNRRGEGSLLRAELVEAAARLVESTGSADAVTLRAVAREAGVAAPSIYRHFTDIAELLRAVVADRFQRLDEDLAQAMAGTSEAGVATLRACCAAYCAFGLAHPGHYRVLFGPVLSFDPATGVPGQDVFQRLVDAVAACRDGVTSADARQAAANVWTALHGIVSLRTSRPTFPWPPVAEQIESALRAAAP